MSGPTSFELFEYLEDHGVTSQYMEHALAAVLPFIKFWHKSWRMTVTNGKLVRLRIKFR